MSGGNLPAVPTRMNPAILKRTHAYRGYLNVDKLDIALADGTTVSRDVEHHGDAVAVLPFDPVRRRALIVSLFRAPVFQETGDSESTEACAGMMSADDVDGQAAVRREAREELGVELSALLPIGRVWSSPGVTTERIRLYLAPYSATDRVSEGGGVPDEHENIHVRECPLSELLTAARDGKLVDSKLLLLVLSLALREPQLFDEHHGSKDLPNEK